MDLKVISRCCWCYWCLKCMMKMDCFGSFDLESFLRRTYDFSLSLFVEWECCVFVFVLVVWMILCRVVVVNFLWMYIVWWNYCILKSVVKENFYYYRRYRSSISRETLEICIYWIVLLCFDDICCCCDDLWDVLLKIMCWVVVFYLLIGIFVRVYFVRLSILSRGMWLWKIEIMLLIWCVVIVWWCLCVCLVVWMCVLYLGLLCGDRGIIRGAVIYRIRRRVIWWCVCYCDLWCMFKWWVFFMMCGVCVMCVLKCCYFFCLLRVDWIFY